MAVFASSFVHVLIQIGSEWTFPWRGCKFWNGKERAMEDARRWENSGVQQPTTTYDSFNKEHGPSTATGSGLLSSTGVLVVVWSFAREVSEIIATLESSARYPVTAYHLLTTAQYVQFPISNLEKYTATQPTSIAL